MDVKQLHKHEAIVTRHEHKKPVPWSKFELEMHVDSSPLRSKDASQAVFHENDVCVRDGPRSLLALRRAETEMARSGPAVRRLLLLVPADVGAI